MSNILGTMPAPLLVNAGEAWHHADWNWQAVRSPFMRIYFVTHGKAWVKMEQLKLELKPGHMYLIPAFTTHSYECHDEFRHFYLHIYDEREEHPTRLLALSKPAEVKPTDMDLALFQRLCQLNPTLKLQDSNPESYDNHAMLLRNIATSRSNPLPVALETKGLIEVLLSRFIGSEETAQEKEIDTRIMQSMDYIQQHLTEQLALTRLASEACMSKDHFIRLFHHHTGITPTRYITRQRMRRAETMLISTNKPIKAIAMSLGYDDTSYFTRVFRSAVGFTPQQYREVRV